MINETMPASAALAAIDSLLANDQLSDNMLSIRAGMIDDDDPDCPPFMRELLAALDTESLTKLALDLSLCPLHFIDYAICFDDDDSECAQIRAIHPSHDT